MAEPEQSIDDWAADLVFGNEAEAPEAEAEERTVEPVVEGDESEEVEAAETEEVEAVEEEAEYGEVEIDGLTYENVPAALIEQIEKGRDYTQKTQGLAEQRREVEVIQENLRNVQKQYEFAQEISPVYSEAQQYDSLAEQWRTYLRDNVDSLSSTEIEKGRMAISDAERARDGLIQQIQAKQQEFDQAREQAVTDLLDKSSQILRGKIQDWDSVEGQVLEHVASLGFTEDQVALAKTDPRQMELAYKAMRYDQLQENKPEAVRQVKGAIKPKSRNPMPKETQDKLNMRKKLKSKAPDKVKRGYIEDSIANSPLFR